jgi:hypothetical protein
MDESAGYRFCAKGKEGLLFFTKNGVPMGVVGRFLNL